MAETGLRLAEKLGKVAFTLKVVSGYCLPIKRTQELNID